jgi:membrane protein implicated in regulation of membrane protease activity
MNGLRTIFREIFGLFVDDGSFALLILLWLGLTTLLLPHLGWVPIWALKWRGVILFAGLAAILMASAIRYAHRNRS